MTSEGSALPEETTSLDTERHICGMMTEKRGIDVQDVIATAIYQEDIQVNRLSINSNR